MPRHSEDELAVINRRQMTFIAVGVVAFLFACAIGAVALKSLKRVDPGNVGLIASYNNKAPNNYDVQPVGVGFHWIGWREKLVDYEVAQQTLTLARHSEDDDKSIACQDNNGVPINIDVSVLWRINVDQIADLYRLRPNIESVNELEDAVVTRDVRSAVSQACSEFTYTEIYGDKRVDFGARARELTGQRLANAKLVMDDFVPGEIYLAQRQKEAVDRIADANAAAEQQRALQAQKEFEANANVAEAEGKKKVAVLEAEGRAESQRIEAEADAAAVVTAADAQAHAIETIKSQVGGDDNYLRYLELEQWNGVLPQVTGGATPFVDVTPATDEP